MGQLSNELGIPFGGSFELLGGFAQQAFELINLPLSLNTTRAVFGSVDLALKFRAAGLGTLQFGIHVPDLTLALSNEAALL